MNQFLHFSIAFILADITTDILFPDIFMTKRDYGLEVDTLGEGSFRAIIKLVGILVPPSIFFYLLG